MAKPSPKAVAYLLDTNIIFETVRSRPEPRVMAWLDSVASEQLFVSVLTLAEIRKGALTAADVPRRQKLLNWLDDVLPAWFDDRVLGIDAAVAARWATLLATAVPHKLPAIDSLLAATAAHHRLTLVTRNVRDFERIDVALLNPWDGV